ncbi:GntR family transcriptional regulator [Jiella pelagia]|uniref:GntR family transcriptional regulator n=1 Tax=Jiella pelagia TaxID=2986949 RepID=UPI0038B34E86
MMENDAELRSVGREYSCGRSSSISSTARLGPGDALNELPLAEALGICRTPVREALRQLSAVGLVERDARHAFVVRQRPARHTQSLRGGGRTGGACGRHGRVTHERSRAAGARRGNR